MSKPAKDIYYDKARSFKIAYELICWQRRVSECNTVPALNPADMHLNYIIYKALSM
jgi:hypothetical protein